MKSTHPFFEHIRGQHPDPNNFDDFYNICHRPLRKSIRVNTLKISVADFERLAQKKKWQLNPIPWCAEGFWIDCSDTDPQFQLGSTAEHLMGLFYIQEASSMLPVIALLANNPAINILDMAAAPGSKTTQLAALMLNQGTILANELSASRIKVLHANLQRMAVTNTCLSHLDGRLLDQHLGGEYFDAILLDAPCGGEGSYRKDPSALNNWSPSAMEKMARVQKQLLKSAWKMLKPKGRLIYSTCTLSREENQEVIEALQNDVASEMTIVNLATLFPQASTVATKEGFLHLWPEIFDCEGFFVACLEKKSTTEISNVNYQLPSQSPFKILDRKTGLLIQQYYQQHFGFDLENLSGQLRIRISQREQQIWLFPDQGESLRKVIRLQRSGIRVCDLIEGRNGTIIKTRHELIICHGALFNRQVVSLTREQTSAYYKGENIKLETTKKLNKGEAVLRYDQYPLGVAKVILAKHHPDTITLKNNLPRDLIRTNVIF